MESTLKIEGVRINWGSSNDSGLVTKPVISIAGFSCYFLFLEPNTKHQLLSKNKKIVTCLRGELEGAYRLKEEEVFIFFDTELTSGEKSTLLFICEDFGDNNNWMEKSDLISWQRVDKIYPGLDIELYRSSKFAIDNHRVNFWYGKPNVNCGIHSHAKESVPFLEFHVQLRGFGWMEIFEKDDILSKKAEVLLSYGQTHRPFYILDEKNMPVYPFHQMRIGEKGSLFIAFEKIVSL